jgi:hypothetical protein
MEDYLKNAIGTLECGAAKVQENLLHIFNQEQIDELLEIYKKNPDPPENTPAAMYFSVRGLFLSQFILAHINKLQDKLSHEDAIYLGMAFYNAGFAVGAALPALCADGYKWLHEAEGIKAISKRATDEKYLPGRQLYKEALDIAKSKWEQGSFLKHHQMKKYLIKEYRNGESLKSPFAIFDPDCGYTEKGLLERLKGLAKEMHRPDLISGQKKSS